jgi:hypothetical protein
VAVVASSSEIICPDISSGSSPLCGNNVAWDINIESSSIDITFPNQNRDSFWNSATFNGLILKDLDWGVQGQITNVTMSTSYSIFPFLDFGADYISVNFSATNGATIDTGSFVSLQIETTHGVPEPATLALFAAGLAGLGFMRRRRLNA